MMTTNTSGHHSVDSQHVVTMTHQGMVVQNVRGYAAESTVLLSSLSHHVCNTFPYASMWYDV